MHASCLILTYATTKIDIHLRGNAYNIVPNTPDSIFHVPLLPNPVDTPMLLTLCDLLTFNSINWSEPTEEPLPTAILPLRQLTQNALEEPQSRIPGVLFLTISGN